MPYELEVEETLALQTRKMMIIVLMGISGSGKSTVGRSLSEKVGWPFVDADDHHPVCNRQKMAKGIPLNDEDREGWLVTLHHILKRWQVNNQSGILACSALKQSYRDTLCTGRTSTRTIDHQDPPQKQNTINVIGSEMADSSLKTIITFVYLRGAKSVIASRMRSRDSHFMPVELLDSQLEALEEPRHDEGIRVLTEDVSKSVDNILSDISDFITVHL